VYGNGSGRRNTHFGNLTYDSGSASQIGPRDARIDASAVFCN